MKSKVEGSGEVRERAELRAFIVSISFRSDFEGVARQSSSVFQGQVEPRGGILVNCAPVLSVAVIGRQVS